MLRKGLTRDEDWIPTPAEQREIAAAIARERCLKRITKARQNGPLTREPGCRDARYVGPEPRHFGFDSHRSQD